MKYRTIAAVSLLVAPIAFATFVLREDAAKPLGTEAKGFYTAGVKYIHASYGDRDWKALIAQGKTPYHRLSGADFRVDDTIQDDSSVYTLGFLDWSFRGAVSSIDQTHWRVVLTDLTIHSGFDGAKSWRRSWRSDASVYLTHEQGHLDLCELTARTFAGAVAEEKPEGIGASRAKACSDLTDKLNTIYNRIAQQGIHAQIDYDKSTRSGWDKVAQAKATAELAVRLSQAGVSDTWTTTHPPSTVNGLNRQDVFQ